MKIEVIDTENGLADSAKVSIQHQLHSTFYHVEEIVKITVDARPIEDDNTEQDHWECAIKLKLDSGKPLKFKTQGADPIEVCEKLIERGHLKLLKTLKQQKNPDRQTVIVS